MDVREGWKITIVYWLKIFILDVKHAIIGWVISPVVPFR